MRCMKKTKTTHGDKDPNPRNKYNLTPETARVGVQIGKVISGVLYEPSCRASMKNFGNKRMIKRKEREVENTR